MNRKNPFRLLIAAIALVVGMAIYAGINGRLTALPQEIMGAVSVPIKRITASISNKISIWQDKYINIDQVVAENQELKEEIAALREKQIDYDKIKLENEQYKEFLNIRTQHPEYTVVSAGVIGRDGLDKFYSFTIDQGEKSGINKNSVVLSSQGVVGVVVETGPNFAKVATILNPKVSVAAFVSSVRETGVVVGNSEYSDQLKTTMIYLAKTTEAKEGDIVSTIGLGGIFPQDLVIGTIEEIINESSGISSFAVIKPTADIAEIKTVFVVTDY